MIKKNKKFLILYILIIIFVIYLSNLKFIQNWDNTPILLTSYSIIENKTIYLDNFENQVLSAGQSFDVIKKVGDHYLSARPLVPAIISSIILFIPVKLNLVDLSNLELAGKIISIFFILGSAYFLFRIIEYLFNYKAGIFLAILFCLTTSNFSFIVQGFWTIAFAELFWSITLFLLILKKSKNFLFLSGLTTALAITCRPSNIIIGLLLMLYVIWQYKKNAWKFIIAPIILGTSFIIYNYYYFDSILGGYNMIYDVIRARAGGIDIKYIFEGITGTLFSPSRGIFIYSPIILLSILGVKYAWSRKEVVFKFIPFIIIFSWLFVICNSIWWDGYSYGNRKISDLLPFIFILIAFFPFSKIKSKFVNSIIIILIIISFLIHLNGFLFYDYGDWNGKPYSVDDSVNNKEKLWGWKDNQIKREFMGGIEHYFSGKKTRK